MLSWFVCSNIEFAFLCLSYFTELVVSIGDFCTLGYLVHCYLKGILKMYTDISLNLFVTHDIFIAYFFVMRILFCVIDRISVCLLSNWVLCLLFNWVLRLMFNWVLYLYFSLNLLVTHDIFIVYFFVIRILFCVVDRISVSLLFNWVLYFYSCHLCFVFELCVWY